MTKKTDPKQKALEQIADLAGRHKISIGEIEKLLKESGGDTTDDKSKILQTLFSYLGGLFIFAGIAVYTAMKWDDMNLAMQLIITLGVGLAAYIQALVFLKDNKFDKAVTPMFLIAALLQPTGLFILLDAYASGGDEIHAILLVTGVMTLQQGGTFWAKRRTVLAFTALTFLTLFTATFLFDAFNERHEDVICLMIGVGLIAAGYVLGKSQHRVLAPFAYFFGSLCALWGSFEILDNTPAEILYLGITAGLIYLSTVAKSRTLLFISSIAMLCYIGYFSTENFPNAVGWPLTLIVMGCIMLGLGAYIFKLSGNIKKTDQTE